MAEIIDLDVFVPEARSVKFTDRAGKKHLFDVTFMSFRSSVFMMAHMDEFQKLTSSKPEDINENDFRLILSVIEDIGKQTDKELTVDFLYDNLSIIQGVKLLEVAMAPIISFVNSNPQDGVAAAEEAGK